MAVTALCPHPPLSGAWPFRPEGPWAGPESAEEDSAPLGAGGETEARRALTEASPQSRPQPAQTQPSELELLPVRG